MATFIDEAKIYAKAGDGGDGCVSWRREKYVPRGGPAGGDGGNGGNVVFVADSQVRSLLDFKYQRHLTAKNGEPGRSKNQYGAAGADAVAKVPLGTEIYDAETGELLCDFTEDGQTEIVLAGGSGGWGNTRFQSATRQAPDFAKPGLPGEERTLRLSLKLLADVGLLGFPNAGKSTFLSSVSAARPKIADYPFTTLVPNLGVVQAGDAETFVIADVPGLIEGASEGAGLGIRFLKHLERVQVICHLLEAPAEWDEELTDDALVERYRTLRRELEAFNPDFQWLPEVVCLNKSDLGEPALSHPAVHKLEEMLRDNGQTLYRMSAATGEGTDAVKHALLTEVKRDRTPEAPTGYDPLAKEKLR